MIVTKLVYGTFFTLFITLQNPQIVGVLTLECCEIFNMMFI